MRRLTLILLAAAALPWVASAVRAGENPDLEPVEPELQVIQRLRNEGDVEGAAAKAERLVSTHPRDLQAHVAHQDVQLALGQESELVKTYRRRARAETAGADDAYLLARLLRGNAALVEYRNALKLDPAHFWTLCGMGAELTELGKYRDAAAALTKARAVDEESGVPVNLLGRVDELRGRMEKAEALYREAVRLAPDLIVARVNLGMLLVNRDEYEAALKELNDAARRAPKHPLPLLARGMAHMRDGHSKRAVQDFQAAADAGGDDVLSLTLLAQAYLNLERYTLAEQALRRAVEKAPQHPQTHVYLAYLHLARGEIDLARASADTALGLDANLAEAHHMRGLCYDRDGRPKKAESAYRRAARMEQRNPVFVRALALLYEAQARWKDAIREYQKVVKLTDKAPPALFELSLAYWGAGKHDRAAATLEDLVESDPEHLDAWLNLGVLYQRHLRKRRQARSAYREYLDRGGQDTRVELWLRELD